jgi:multidrug resistance efflux pump
MTHWGRALVGPRHTGLKLFSALVTIAILGMTFIHVDYRVAAKTVVEGAVQRAAVAPFEGYVAESLVRAGDTVVKGQLIVRLDERDLLVERAKWDAEREQHLRKYRQALANYDRASMSVIGAQVNQAEAQLNLVDEKLTRAIIVAPFDGVVVSGDLSQLLGSPVEQGKVLFEIAPLDAYRVILKVDERDITYVALAQRGELRLSGLPSSYLPFTVKQITSVSTAEEGRNYFRVEAHVESTGGRLRPGMEGVGKIITTEHSLIWIWTHNLTDWLRLTLWSWLP